MRQLVLQQLNVFNFYKYNISRSISADDGDVFNVLVHGKDAQKSVWQSSSVQLTSYSWILGEGTPGWERKRGSI